MGLDSYFYAVKKEHVLTDDEINFKINPDVKHDEFRYYRKHNQLHGWMEQLYKEKGGDNEDVNLSKIRLNETDLNKLKKDVRLGLPDAQGFFWGHLTIDKAVKMEYYDLIKECKDKIKDGYVIYYNSWY